MTAPQTPTAPTDAPDVARAVVQYRPAYGEDASWIAADGAAFAVFASSVDAHTAEAVWRRLGEGVAAVLDALAGAFGTSLAAIPPFALAVAEPGGVRVAVRGPLTLSVESAAGVEEISGAGAATWTERLVADVRRVILSPSDAAGTDAAGKDAAGKDAAGKDAAVPLRSGVALADLAVAVLTAGAVAADSAGPARPTPAPAETSAPAPAPAPVAVSAPPPEALPAPALPEPVLPEAVPAVPLVPLAVPLVPAAVPPVPTTPPAAAARAASLAAADDDDSAWADTIARPRASKVTPAGQDVQGGQGDHDGATVSVAEARALRAAEREQYESTDGVPLRRPVRGRITLSTGPVIELERTVVIGRRPKATRTSASELPLLVAVESPRQDISRSHVEIRAEGEHVLVTDLDTTNGTVLLRVGGDPVRLHPGEPTLVVTGDALDLGDGVVVTFEDLP